MFEKIITVIDRGIETVFVLDRGIETVDVVDDNYGEPQPFIFSFLLYNDGVGSGSLLYNDGASSGSLILE